MASELFGSAVGELEKVRHVAAAAQEAVREKTERIGLLEGERDRAVEVGVVEAFFCWWSLLSQTGEGRRTIWGRVGGPSWGC